MADPLFLSTQYVGTALSIYFDVAIDATPTDELDGFTFELNGTPFVPVFASIDENALIVTLGGAPNPGDELTVEYDGAGTIVDAATGLDSAPAFGPEEAIETEDPVLVYQGEVTDANNVIVISFNEPVAATDNDLLTGMVFTIDDVVVPHTGVTAEIASDMRSISYTFPSNFTYDDVVSVEYDGLGELYSWPSGDVDAFELLNIFNRSTDGLPTSQYPLSYVSKYEVVMKNFTATPKLGVSLNPVDIALVSEYGPARVTTGGVFGVTGTNPDGISVAGKMVDIIDGAELTQLFYGNYSAADIMAAARDWQDVVIVRIGIALGKVRADGQSITPSGTVIVQV